MKIGVYGNSPTVQSLSRRLEAAGHVVVGRPLTEKELLLGWYEIRVNDDGRLHGIILDGVECDLEHRVAKHLTTLVTHDLVLRRRKGENTSDRRLFLTIPTDEESHHAVDIAVVRGLETIPPPIPVTRVRHDAYWQVAFFVLAVVAIIAAMVLRGHAQTITLPNHGDLEPSMTQVIPEILPDAVTMLKAYRVELAQAEATVVERDGYIAVLQMQLADEVHERQKAEKQTADLQLSMRAKEAIRKLRQLTGASDTQDFDWATKTFRKEVQ